MGVAEKAPKPLWRRAFDATEQTVAPHLERGVQSSAFADAVALAQQGSAGVRKRVDGVTRGVWHLLNLPARSDVRRLRRQVSSLDREVRLLREVLESTLVEERKGSSGGGGVGADGSADAGGSPAQRPAGARGRAGASAARRGAQRTAGAQRDQAGGGGG
ncbi:MAG: hypothetical protein M3P93_08460 [Actinomycetota bacterium]|nr:hypothetical protein [Actinomycetota bacterium]